MPSEKTVCVVLTDDLINLVREAARKETISMSAVVRKALRQYFSPANVHNIHLSSAYKAQ